MIWALTCTSMYNVVAFTPIPLRLNKIKPTPRQWDSLHLPEPSTVLAMTSSSDIMNWFLNEPASPIFMMMVKKLPPETWDPIKYQLDSTPVFYCGIEDVKPATIPFPCFLDVDDAKAELQSQRVGKGFGEEKAHDVKLDLLPMMLGDAFENNAVGYSTIKCSRKNLSLSGDFKADGDDFVPVFGVKMLVKSEEDGSIITGLTDRLYFDGEQAKKMLKEIVDKEGSDEVKYELFVVSLVKAIEYMILDKESDFKFEFIPPTSTMSYISSAYDV